MGMGRALQVLEIKSNQWSRVPWAAHDQPRAWWDESQRLFDQSLWRGSHQTHWCQEFFSVPFMETGRPGSSLLSSFCTPVRGLGAHGLGPSATVCSVTPVFPPSAGPISRLWLMDREPPGKSGITLSLWTSFYPWCRVGRGGQRRPGIHGLGAVRGACSRLLEGGASIDPFWWRKRIVNLPCFLAYY